MGNNQTIFHCPTVPGKQTVRSYTMNTGPNAIEYSSSSEVASLETSLKRTRIKRPSQVFNIFEWLRPSGADAGKWAGKWGAAGATWLDQSVIFCWDGHGLYIKNFLFFDGHVETIRRPTQGEQWRF